MTIQKHVDFEHPPVIEVVCGVSFTPPPGFTVAHLGRFWEELGSDFPEVKEVAPLVAVSERFDGSSGVGIAIQVQPQVMMMPRVWFISSGQDHLVQVQRDRFLSNWRKVAAQHKYPSYAWVGGKFEEDLQRFESFASRQFGSAPAYTQYELTYVNHLLQGSGWSNLGDLGKVFPDCAWRPEVNRFLPMPEAIDWSLSFPFPDRKGRLHIHLRSGERTEDKRAVLVLELTARGFSPDRAAWFDLAHEWIVRGFADLIGQNVQKSIWRRTK